MKALGILVVAAFATTFGATGVLAAAPDDYVAANGCATGNGTAALFSVPADRVLLVTDIYIGSNEAFATMASPFTFEVLQSGTPVQTYRTNPHSTNGFTQEKAIELNLRLGSPLVIDASNTLQIEATLPASWSSVEWCASIGGELVSLLALGAADPLPAPDENGIQLAIFPNPSRQGQRLRFSTEEPAYVTLDIFNVAGQRVARLQDDILPPGNHELAWNGEDGDGTVVASGTYFPKLTVADRSVTGRIVVLN